MKKTFLTFLLVWFSVQINAQINEIGIFLGGSNYVGDIGASTYIRPNSFASGIIYKYNKTPRLAYRASLTNMGINPDDSDSSNEVQNFFQNSFSKNISELAVGIEFNFFEYNLANYRQRSTPYLFFELAAFQYKKAESIAPSVAPTVNINYTTERGIAIPFGIGYKTSLFGKLAISLEARIRYTFTDDLDDGLFIKENIIDPSSIVEKAKFNNPNTNDWYMATGISIVYTFGRPACYSRNRF
jgi:hypothetical protein